MNKVLVIAAHPDDEVLGCGGTIKKHTKNGDAVYVLIMAEGITSRDTSKDSREELQKLKKACMEANKSLGVTEVFFGEFPDNQMDTVSLLEIVKKIELYVNKVNPNIIYTHSNCDLNIDHKLCFQATMTATRPVNNSPVKELYCFETLSSTEWQFNNSFNPNFFVDISDVCESKKLAMKFYDSELKQWPHPRSLEGIHHLMAIRGSTIGCNAAEAFETVRVIR